MVIKGECVLAGCCTGNVVWTEMPLSFWGDVNPQNGQIVDRHHPLFGRSVARAILVMPATRGSSTSSGVLLEMIRTQTAPIAIITRAIEPVLTLGGIIGAKVYQRSVVMLTVGREELNVLEFSTHLTIGEDGTISIPENGMDVGK